MADHSIHRLPSPRQAMLHIALLAVLAGVVGPVLGPVVVGWFNPIQAWGGQGASLYAPMNVLQWGLAMLMFEAFIYTAWLIRRAHKRPPEDEAAAWWNQQ